MSALPVLLLSLAAAIDLDAAARAFAEARAATAKDGGRLFGVSLDRPLLFVDPATRQAAGDRSGREGALRPEGGVFVGAVPKSIPLANTSVEWGGERWAMILWPLPEDARERVRLLVHESFHVAQKDLGLPAASPANSHLDALDGRLFLQLEWRALRAALLASGDARKSAARDALLFREHRAAVCGGNARAEERALEINEGLAEYAGVVLAGFGPPDVARRLDTAPGRFKTLARSFAYESGPAYGLLLDAEAGPSWRESLSSASDLGLLLGAALDLRTPEPDALSTEAERRLAAYDGAALRASESAREERRRERLSELRKRFVEGPVLIVSLTPATRFSFDPGSLESLDGAGTVYPTLEMSGEWGTLEVRRGGALIDSGWRHVSVPAPGAGDGGDGNVVAGDGYVLRLAAGWRLLDGERAGDRAVRRDS